MDDATLTRIIGEQLGTVPGWAWRPDGSAFTAAEVGLVYGALPGKPDRVIGIRVYALAGDATQQTEGRRVQLRSRGGRERRDGADALAHIASVVMDGLTRRRGISSVERDSFAPLSSDNNARQERTDNYTVIFDNTEATP